jgi:phosphoribosylformylglycinamidine synthase
MAGNKLVLLTTCKKEDGTIDMDKFKKNLEVLYTLIGDKKVVSASSIKFGGVSEAITKMTLGNRIGAEFNNLNKEELFGLNYGSILLEVNKDVNVDEEFKACTFKLVGETIADAKIKSKEFDLEFVIEDLDNKLEEKLSSVFKIKTEDTKDKVETVTCIECPKKKMTSPKVKVAKPKVVIPVFPGTNCEDDCARAFLKEGAEVSQVILRNLNKEILAESIDKLEAEIRTAQIIMLPGGFSAGDEPDGSGKFIATVFRNEKIKAAVMDLLNNRDGLMLGICNGFQALIKLGLVPYGEIRDIDEDMATLTYNNINRHMSSMVRTKISSTKSPWFSEVDINDIHTIPISHGEGRFVAPEGLIKELEKNGQIATQYVDLDGEVTLNMPYNPNGSMVGIEGITSPDGRILGKMGHSERIAQDLYKNIPGNFDQKIFKAGVNYFK